jgi:hypothetical protein
MEPKPLTEMTDEEAVRAINARYIGQWHVFDVDDVLVRQGSMR